MSFPMFSNIAGFDNLIDRHEFSNYYQMTHPFSGPGAAHEAFNLIDRNRDGRIDYFEFRDSQYRNPGVQYFNSYNQYYHGRYFY